MGLPVICIGNSALQLVHKLFVVRGKHEVTRFVDGPKLLENSEAFQKDLSMLNEWAINHVLMRSDIAGTNQEKCLEVIEDTKALKVSGE